MRGATRITLSCLLAVLGLVAACAKKDDGGIAGVGLPGVCGNRVCEPGVFENSLSCPADCGALPPGATPTPTPTPGGSPTPTPTPSPTPTPNGSPTPTPTATPIGGVCIAFDPARPILINATAATAFPTAVGSTFGINMPPGSDMWFRVALFGANVPVRITMALSLQIVTIEATTATLSAFCGTGPGACRASYVYGDPAAAFECRYPGSTTPFSEVLVHLRNVGNTMVSVDVGFGTP